MLNSIDIHAHLDFPQFDVDREKLIARAEAEGLGIINVGTDEASSAAVVALTETSPNLWATIGLHPQAVTEKYDWENLKKLAAAPRVVAIGECGLDYFGQPEPKVKAAQGELFERQIALAVSVGKPLMLHIREAYDDVLAILRAGPATPFHVHFFAGDWKRAKQFIDIGGSLSFTGVITFTDTYDEIVRKTPLDRLLFETDSPFVVPVPYRGKRNEPAYVNTIIAHAATLRSLPVATLREANLTNARRVFGLEDRGPIAKPVLVC